MAKRVIDTGIDTVDWQLNSNGTAMAMGTDSGATRVVHWPDYQTTKYHLPPDGNRMAYIAQSADDSLLVTKPWAGNLRLTELATGNSIFEDWGEFPIFDASSTKLAINQSNKIRFYEIVRPNQVLKTWRSEQPIALHSGSFSPNGKWFASDGWNRVADLGR